MFNFRDALEYAWADQFQSDYGCLRNEVKHALDRYLNCGILRHGCAKAYCPECGHSELIPFSCKRRCLCSSCDAKRAVLFAEHLVEKVLLPYPHHHGVFSIPKRLRCYFKFDRGLLGGLYTAAWNAWKDEVAKLCPAGESGAVMALHSFGDLLSWHHHS